MDFKGFRKKQEGGQAKELQKPVTTKQTLEALQEYDVIYVVSDEMKQLGEFLSKNGIDVEIPAMTNTGAFEVRKTQ